VRDLKTNLAFCDGNTRLHLPRKTEYAASVKGVTPAFRLPKYFRQIRANGSNGVLSGTEPKKLGMVSVAIGEAA
jgi:hypothetical protein